MTDRRYRARAISADARSAFVWAPFAFAGLIATLAAAHGQTDVPPEKMAPRQKVTPPAVIHPQPHIDPAMRVPPPAAQHYPTPVIKPQTKHGNTVVVPK